MSFPVLVIAAVALVATGSALPVGLPVTSVTSEGDMSSVSWARQEVTPNPTLTTDHSTHQTTTPTHQPSTPAGQLTGASEGDSRAEVMPSEGGQQGEAAGLVLSQPDSADAEEASSTDVTVTQLKIVTSRSLDAMETAFQEVCSSLPVILREEILKKSASSSNVTSTFMKSADARVYRLVRRDWRELKDQSAGSLASLSQQQQVAMQDALYRLNALKSLLEQYLQPGSTEEEARTRQTPQSDLTQFQEELALQLASYVQHLKALRAGLDSWTQG